MTVRFYGHVKQPTPRTCVHACLSMVTGDPVQTFIDRFGDEGVGFEDYLPVLVEYRLFPNLTVGDLRPFPYQGVYLAVVPSLNLPGRTHMVVVVVDENGPLVYDPNVGRGVEVVHEKAASTGHLLLVKVFYLDPYLLREMRNPIPVPALT